MSQYTKNYKLTTEKTQEEIVIEMGNCINKGEIVSSNFVKSEQWYSEEFVKYAWLYFMLKSPEFKNKFPQVDTSQFSQLEEQLNNYITPEMRKIYDTFWEHTFKNFIIHGINVNCNNYCVLMCSSTNSMKSNAAIIFDGQKFSVIAMANSSMAINQMRDKLIEEDAGYDGHYTHVIIAKNSEE